LFNVPHESSKKKEGKGNIPDQKESPSLKKIYSTNPWELKARGGRLRKRTMKPEENSKDSVKVTNKVARKCP